MKKIHHVGVATNNLSSLKQEYIKKGYICINEIYDNVQKATLSLLKNKERCIELVYTDDIKSKVYNICHSNYEKAYHVCYIVDSLEKEIEKLKSKGCLLFTEIYNAELLNARVCFLYTKNKKIIEIGEYYE